MNISIGNKIVLGFAVALFLLAGMGWLSYRTTRNLIVAGNGLVHTHEVIATLEEGIAILTDAETSQRGYLLTGDQLFLSDCWKAQAKVDGWIDKIRALVADNPGQRRRIDNLEPLMRQRMAVLNTRIQLRQEQGLQAAADAVATRKGKEVMDKVWQGIALLREEEDRLLLRRQAAAELNATRSLNVIVTGTVLACLVGTAGLLTIRRDLQRREEAERALQESRNLLESFCDNTPAVVFLKDLKGRYLFVNRRFAELAGHGREAIKGKTAFDLFPEEIARVASTNDETVRSLQGPLHCEETVRYPEGPHTHLAVKFPLFDAGGRIYATGGVSTDITARKFAEEERDRFFELSRDMICIAGFDGFFKRLNPSWERALGYSREELLSKPFMDFIHPDDLAPTKAQGEKLAGGNEVVSFENRYRHKNGSYHWFDWNARPDRGARLIYASARDVTGQKELHLQLQAANEQLRLANQELESFSYSVSHDLRAPLRHIDGFVKLLDRQIHEKLDDRGRRFLTVIATAARQMGALIDDLLAFSRMSRAELSQTMVDLPALVPQVVDDLKGEAGRRRIVWKIGALPEVQADFAMLKQVWVNLITNAMKYSRPRDPAEIEIGCADSAPGEHVFFVRDNGVGFDMQYADKLFKVFQRLHHAEDFEGTGIGLANVSRIVHRHGGRVWAEGKIDAGATFYFTLPKPPTPSKG